MGTGQNISINRNLEEADSNLMDDFEMLKTSVKQVTAEVVEN